MNMNMNMKYLSMPTHVGRVVFLGGQAPIPMGLCTLGFVGNLLPRLIQFGPERPNWHHNPCGGGAWFTVKHAPAISGMGHQKPPTS